MFQQVHRCSRIPRQVAHYTFLGASPNLRCTQSTAVGILFGQPRIVGVGSSGRTKSTSSDNISLKRGNGVSRHRYSTSAGARKRSFLFDEPPVRGHQTPIPEGNQNETPSAERDAIAGKDARINRDSLQDPFGKRLMLRRYLGSLTQYPRTARMVASPIRRCVITGAKIPKGNVLQFSSSHVQWLTTFPQTS